MSFKLYACEREAPLLGAWKFLRQRVEQHLSTAFPANAHHQLRIMDHSTAIMEDAGKAIDKAAAPPAADPALAQDAGAEQPSGDGEQASNNDNQQRKRKGNFPDSSIRHGSRKGGRQSDGDNKRHKKVDMGRADYL
jgi:hypothetical protein